MGYTYGPLAPPPTNSTTQHQTVTDSHLSSDGGGSKAAVWGTRAGAEAPAVSSPAVGYARDTDTNEKQFQPRDDRKENC